MIKNNDMFEGTLEEAVESGMSYEISGTITAIITTMISINMEKVTIRDIPLEEIFKKKIRIINGTEDISLEILKDED